MVSLVLLLAAAASSLAAVAVAASPPPRTVSAWASGSAKTAAATIKQLTDPQWKGLIDVVQLNGCGFVVNTTTNLLEVNATEFNDPDGCQAVLSTLSSLGIEVEMWVGGVPDAVVASPDAFIQAASALLKEPRFAAGSRAHVKGIHWDEETECAPRATLKNFTRWMGFMDQLSDAMHAQGVRVSVAVQALFGIEDAPYAKNRPCLQAPWKYPQSDELTALLSNSKVDRWLEMDTVRVCSGGGGNGGGAGVMATGGG